MRQFGTLNPKHPQTTLRKSLVSTRKPSCSHRIIQVFPNCFSTRRLRVSLRQSLFLMASTLNFVGRVCLGKSVSRDETSKPLFLCLRENGGGKQRGHFERMWPTEKLEQYFLEYWVDQLRRSAAAHNSERDRRQMGIESNRGSAASSAREEEGNFSAGFPKA